MKPIYTFADCDLDVQKHVLYRAGIEVSLEPKVFQVLLYLLQHRDRVIGKEELLEQCWPDTFVSEWALSRCLSKIRKSIQPDRKGVPMIKTVHGQGYRFVAEVATSDPSQPPRRDQDAVRATATPSLPAPAQPLQSRILPAIGRPTKAEWRQLTVLHVGFVDAVMPDNQLDAEDLHALQQSVHNDCTEVIERFAGSVAQYLPDGMVGYFGYPQAHDDDALRAVRAGLELCATLNALRPTVISGQGAALAIRVGIHTGQVVVGGGNPRMPPVSLAVGDAPAVASKLQMLAQPNTVLISGETARLTAGFFVWQVQGDHILPDLGESMPIYQVQRPSSARTRIDAAGPQGLTAFVGRESELALLQNRWAQVQEGLGQVVLISGEAGIGKTRLLQVFKDSLDPTAHTRLEAQCVSFFQNSALHPVTQLLPHMLHWENDNLSVKLDKLERALQSCGLSVAETAPLLTSLLSLPVPPDAYTPLSASPQVQRQRTFNALVAMLQDEALHQPTVLVVEDLHWADPSTLEWLDVLLEQVAVCKLLLILTCRPSFEPPWGLRSYLTPVALNRLMRNQVEVMITHLLGGDRLPANLVRHLVDKTDGVPLYIEELTKTVLASGQVKEVGGHYNLVGSLSSLRIPATLQDSLIARLDQLGAAKEIAQLGSILGREFSHHLIHAVSAVDDEAILQEGLSALVKAELLHQRGVPPRITYRFKHALIQDAAYQSLLRRKRRQLHQRIAQVLESQFPETVAAQPERMAHHAFQGEVWDKAMVYFRQSGDRAMARSAYQEAVMSFESALEAFRHLPAHRDTQEQALDLYFDLRNALIPIAGHHRILAVLREAQSLAESLGDWPRLGQICIYTSRSFMQLGMDEKALQAIARAQQVAAANGDRGLQIIADYRLGLLYFNKTDYHRGIDVLSKITRSLADARPDERFGIILPPPIMSRAYLGNCLANIGLFGEAIAQGEAAVRLVQTIDHPYAEGLVYRLVGDIYRLKGELPKAACLLERAYQLDRAGNFRSYAAGLLGNVYALVGRLTEALALLEEAQQLLDLPVSNLSIETYLLIDRLDEAHDLAGQVLEFNRGHNRPGNQAVSLCLLGDIVLHRAALKIEQAEAYYQQSLLLAEELGMRPLQAHCYRGLGAVYRQTGRFAQARAGLSKALEMYREMQMTFWLPETETALAQNPSYLL